MQGHAFFIRKMAWDIDGKNDSTGAVASDRADIIYSKAFACNVCRKLCCRVWVRQLFFYVVGP